MKRTLAIETSCDDTSLAIVTYDGDFFECEEMLSFSQVDIHAPYGGVVPELAYRSHADKIVRMLEEMKIDVESIDFISVTTHPGLPWSLVVWTTTAHMLGQLWSKEVVEVNHIMGHIFSTLLWRSLDDIQFPYVCLTVSGGHNDMYVVRESEEWGVRSQEDNEAIDLAANTNRLDVPSKNDAQPKHKRHHLPIWWSLTVGPFEVTKIAQTLDDASWEVYDKVSRMLGGPYPWWYRMDCHAQEWSADDRVDLRINTLQDRPLQFSFSGIKSQVYNLLKKFEREEIELDDELKKNIAWKFQQVVAKSLVKHAIQACKKYSAKTLGVVGGVSANSELRKQIKETIQEKELGYGLLIPEKLSYCMDNGAMIWVVGHLLR